MNRIQLGFAFCISLVLGDALHAATVTLGSPPSDGLVYRWTVEMDATDSTGGDIVRHVGSLSFNDPINFSDPNGYFGWTHTSDWIALELTEPAYLTVGVSQKAGVPNGTQTAGPNLYPAFAIWTGWHVVDGDDHVYNNAGNFNWAPDLSFLGNQPNGTGLAAVSHTFLLPAGLYSIVIGGNPPAGTTASRQGYEAVLTTQPVPEPGTLALALSGAALGGLALRRRAGSR